MIRCAWSIWCGDETHRRRTASGWRPSTRATSPDRMIAARAATVVVLLAAAARVLAAPDAGAGADAAASTRDAAADAVPAAGDGGADAAPPADAAAAGDAAAGTSAAPTVPLRGRVLEKGTRRPLPGAAVTIDGAPAGETDAAGNFELRVAPGHHRVQIQTAGHDTADRPVDAAIGAATDLEPFRLAPRLTGERYETTVRSGRPEIPQVAVSGDEARAVAGTSGDPLRVIASLPGVQQIVWPASI